jgi:hypothetical protein
MPFDPNFIAVATAFFIARRNATRRSSCVAMFSATSCAFVSGLRTSWTSMNTSLPVNACTPGNFGSPFAAVRRLPTFSVSMPLPPLPMTIPGLAVYTITLALFAARSTSTPAMFAL